MEEFTYYRKNLNDTYAFFYSEESRTAWVVYMPGLPINTMGSGRTVVTLEGIKDEKEAFKELKEAVDKL